MIMALLIRNYKYFDVHQAFKMLSVNSSNTFRVFSTNAELSVVNLDTEDAVLSTQEKEQRIEKLRNVSRLNPEHRNIIHDQVPYSQPKAEYHLSVKYRRKMYGKYGSKSGVNPGIMWPTKEDIEERKEYESVAYPFTIQDMVKAEISKHEEEKAEIMARQKKLDENMKKLNKWMKDLEYKRANKIKKLTEAKAKKDRLIEEVRRHFGYTVDHREERFQQMLEQKEKEERRALKAEKLKQRQDIMMQELIAEAQKKMDKEK